MISIFSNLRRSFGSLAVVALWWVVLACGASSLALACSSPGPAVHEGTDHRRHPEPGRNLLWQVQGRRNVVYLLGSVHVGDPTLYPLSDPVEEAFRRSKFLAVEVDVEENPGAAGQEALKYGAYSDGRNLHSVLPADLWFELDNELKKHSLRAAGFANLKPWFVAMMLMNLRYEETAYSAQFGVDRHFLRRARGRIPILELESAALQMNMFNLLDDELQIQLLRDTLAGDEGSVKRLSEIVEAWRVGDDRTLESFLFADDPDDRLSLAMRKIVFDDRNLAMTARIERYLTATEPCFVIVGAGHLLGEKGIVALLRHRGYLVERL